MCGHFYWELRGRIRDSVPRNASGVQVDYATDEDLHSVAEVFFEGLRQEEGSPWDGWLGRHGIESIEAAGRWISRAGGLRGRILVAKRNGVVIGMCGLTMLDPGLMRMFTGIIVMPSERRKNIGSLLLHQSLVEALEAGAITLDVYTITGIPAAKYLYPKYGGVEDEKD